jgi:hypothetical protein
MIVIYILRANKWSQYNDEVIRKQLHTFCIASI